MFSLSTTINHLNDTLRNMVSSQLDPTDQSTGSTSIRRAQSWLQTSAPGASPFDNPDDQRFATQLGTLLNREQYTADQIALIRIFYAFSELENFIIKETNLSMRRPHSQCSNIIAFFRGQVLPVVQGNFLRLHWLFNQRLSSQRMSFEQLPLIPQYPVVITTFQLRTREEIMPELHTLKEKVSTSIPNLDYRLGRDVELAQQKAHTFCRNFMGVNSWHQYIPLVGLMRFFNIYPWVIQKPSYSFSFNPFSFRAFSPAELTTRFICILKELYFTALYHGIFNLPLNTMQGTRYIDYITQASEDEEDEESSAVLSSLPSYADIGPPGYTFVAQDQRCCDFCHNISNIAACIPCVRCNGEFCSENCIRQHTCDPPAG